ncbi:hypothetical protein FRC12_001386 [Ceratobasidium sp. 428]|nr:hypothetical protein FRC12_001386 [Ceratobasidium sp. 428]
MSPSNGWYQCHGCRSTYKTEQRLNQHIAHVDKCRGHEERYLQTLRGRPHRPTATPNTLLRSWPPPAQPSSATNPASDNSVHTVTATTDGDPVNTPPSDLEDNLAAGAEAQGGDDSWSSSPQLLFGTPGLIPRKTYGYAKVKTHPNAAKVFEWVEPRQTFAPNNPLNQPELFKTREWLCQLPISKEERAMYFDIERHKQDIPWKTATQLYQSVDALPHGPSWTHKYMTVTTPQGVCQSPLDVE